MTLLPDRDDRFNFKEQPETSIRFKKGSDQTVSEIEMSTAAGVFTIKRKQP